MKEIQQEITPITNEDLFIILNHPNAHFDYPIHCHPEYEINLVMNTIGIACISSILTGDSTEGRFHRTGHTFWARWTW